MPGNTGGTAGACDGTLVLNWDAWQLSNPGAPGQPWAVGARARVQAWFRDPWSCKFSFLSPMLDLTYGP